jgi:hypothetical protein
VPFKDTKQFAMSFLVQENSRNLSDWFFALQEDFLA